MNKATLTKEEKNKKTNKMGLHAPTQYTIKMKWLDGSHSNIEQWLLLNIENN